MKKFLYSVLLVLLFTSANYTQQASTYFPTDTGHKWKFRMTLLDSLNQPVPSAITFRADSFAFTANYFGREAKYIVSKSGTEELLPLLPYTDSTFLNMSNTEAFEYYRNGGLSSILFLLDSLGLDSSFINLFQSFSGWNSKYRFAATINSNYTILSFDTTVTFDSTTLPLRFEFKGKRISDQSIQTEIGNFNCKRFLMGNVISYLLTIPPFPPIAIPILTYDDSVWIAPSNWIVKEFAPSTTIDLSILGFPVVTIPGFTSEIMPPVAVPVELTSFTASAKGTGIVLMWQTATEKNNLGFEVQKKLEEQFLTIGFVQGYGTTTEAKEYSFTDSKLNSGVHIYRLKQIDFNGVSTYSKEIEFEFISPASFTLEQNYPNPFNPVTKIKYSVGSEFNASHTWVTLKVFDVLGNEVATLVDESKPAGTYEVEFQSTVGIHKLSSGIYFYQLKAGGFTQSKKMVLLK